MQSFIEEAITFLKAAHARGDDGELATLAFSRIKEGFPSSNAELLWTRHPVSNAPQFGLVAQLEDASTISLQHHPRSSLPWVLREAVRWTEGDVVRVNDKLIRIEDVVAALEVVWRQTGIARWLVDDKLISEEFARRGLSVPENELQLAMDRFRAERGLGRAEDMHTWLKDNGLSQERLEETLEVGVARGVLRHVVIPDDVVEDHLATHLNDYDAAIVMVIEGVSAAALEVLRREAHRGTEALISAALSSGHLPTIRRLLRKDAARVAQLFDAEPGHVVHEHERVELLLRVEVAHAQSETMRSAARSVLFEQWLTQQRAAASVLWFWGPDALEASESVANFTKRGE